MIDRTCSACAYYREVVSTEVRGFWKKREVQVRRELCYRFGPDVTPVYDARGSWRPPAVIGPGAASFFVAGPCGLEGTHFEPAPVDGAQISGSENDK